MAIDPQFNKVVQYLVGAENGVASGTFGSGQRPWVNFSQVARVGKFDYKGIDDIFTRKALDDGYTAKRQDKGTLSKDIQTDKLSADYLAGCCRDYKMRTRSRIRMLIHGGNRAAANGTATGPLLMNSIEWLSRIANEDKK
jgi:hypothetical protein